MKESLIGNLLRFLPKNMLSYLLGKLVALPLPLGLGRKSVEWFSRRYHINLAEAEKPVSEYPTIAALFTRKLKAGLRPIGEGLIHPVDGLLTTTGRVKHGELIQAKGKTYTIDEFLGESTQGKYDGYAYLTYYLCPADYHRVHAPLDAEVHRVSHIPGRLWPVNPWSVRTIKDLFSVNERLVFWLQVNSKPVILVMVGATNVGKMTVSFDPLVVTNQTHWRLQKDRRYEPAQRVKKGQELGVFNMGSTVIVLYPPEILTRLPRQGHHQVKLGQSLSNLLSRTEEKNFTTV